jgi:hypothetical protein
MKSKRKLLNHFPAALAYRTPDGKGHKEAPKKQK